MGKLHGSLGQYEKAAAEFETAVDLSPDDPRIHYGLAVTYMYQHLIEDAIRHAEIASDLGFELADQLLVQLRQSSSASSSVGKPSHSSTEDRAQALLDEGVERKRRGDYSGAKAAYYRVIEISATSIMSFYSLAKVCYLTGEQFESIINHLRAMHLSICAHIHALSHNAGFKRDVEHYLQEIPADTISELRSIHAYAPLLLLDIYTPIHLAHTLLDLDQENPKPAEMQEYIPIYRSALSGYGEELADVLDGVIEDSYYRPIGIRFFLENLNWGRIESSNVMELYPGPEQMLPDESDIPNIDDLEPWPFEDEEDSEDDFSLTEGQDSEKTLILGCPTCGEILGFRASITATWKCPVCGNLTTFENSEIVGMWHPETSGIAEPTIRVYQPIQTPASFGFGNPFGEGAPSCSVVWMIERGQKLLEEGKIDQAIIELEKSLKLRANHAGAHLLLGNAYTAKRLLHKALSAFQQSVEAAPDFFLAHYNLGLTYLELNNFKEAANEFQRVIELKPDFADGYYHLGLVYFHDENISKAAGCFEKAAQLNPKDVPTAVNLSNCHKIQGRLQDTMKELRRIIALCPDASEPHHNLGMCYADLGELDKAIQEFQLALRSSPDDIDTHRALGVAFKQKNQLAKAITEFKAVLRLAPDDLPTRFALGGTYLQQEMFVNGTITNDKFCLSRTTELRLSWRRGSRGGRKMDPDQVSY